MGRSYYKCANPVCTYCQVAVIREEIDAPVLCGYCGLPMRWLRSYDVQSKFK